MNTRSILIGACDAKRSYQTNLAIGFGISGLMHIALVVAILMLATYHPTVTIPIDTPIHPTGVDIIPPVIKESPTPHPPNPDQSGDKPNLGVPTSVADSLVLGTTDIPTQNDLTQLAPTTPITDLTDNIIVVDTTKVVEILLPARGAPSFYDEPPVAINSVQPDYPDLARRSGLEGTVWLEVLIDKDGNVRDAYVVKCNNSDRGFEEAALAAAWKSVWKPAVSNGLPIAVRVTYSVVFKLQKS